MNTQFKLWLSFLLLQNNESINSGRQVNTNWFKMLGQFFFLIIVFAIILAAAYYVTRWIGNVQYQRYQGNNIKVIESIVVAPQKTLQLIQVGNKIHLIGITKDNIVYLAEIDNEQIKSFPGNDVNLQSVKFDVHLKQWMTKLKKESHSKDASHDEEDHE